MAARDAYERMDQAWQNLNRQWGETCQFWRDQEQRNFAAMYWQEIERTVNDYLAQLNALDEELTTAQNNCP